MKTVPDNRIESLRGATYAFVDVETTGTSAAYGNIIEIGIIRVEDGVITDTYQSLVQPNRPLLPIITSITGIRDADHMLRFGPMPPMDVPPMFTP